MKEKNIGKKKTSKKTADPKEKKGKRRSIVSTLSASLRSEDSGKTGPLKDRLSSDMLKQVLQGARNSRDEIAGRFGTELTRLLSKIDITNEVKKVLEDYKIKFSAEIEFVPKDKASCDETGAEIKSDRASSKKTNKERNSSP